jgi:hypothetical protein
MLVWCSALDGWRVAAEGIDQQPDPFLSEFNPEVERGLVWI